MSRQAAGSALATAIALVAPPPAWAQVAPPRLTANEVLARAKAALEDPAERDLRARSRETDCAPPKEGEEIVVCAELPDDPESAGYDSERAERDYAERTADSGNPRAPDLGPPPCVPSLLTYCGVGGPLPRPLLIDLASIPEAADDSDAARIGRGEKAR